MVNNDKNDKNNKNLKNNNSTNTENNKKNNDTENNDSENNDSENNDSENNDSENDDPENDDPEEDPIMNEEDLPEEFNNPLKRKIDNDENNLSFFFKKIIQDNFRDPPKKIQKKENISDDFKSYFRESSNLLPINKEIKTIKDLIELGKNYDKYDPNRYVINVRSLNKCVSALEELDNMIGMKNIKEMIIDLIFFRLQNFEDKKEELWHLVIQGNPGCGKTEVSKIIGKLYYGLGITKKNKFTSIKRSDLIGKYLGHTAKKTQEVFDNAKGGILFIDEAYSLGNPEQRDSFSKECIDTINQNLTENKDTIVFIAGYKDQLNESFFSYNPGLNRRFKMRLTIDKYTPSEIRDIFIKKIKEDGWYILNDNINKEIPIHFFESNKDTFKYSGGDMENLWHLTKIVHSRRIFGKSVDLMKKINYDDLKNGFKLYSENDEVKNRKDDNTISKYILDTMYV